jgi:anti-sigma factor RsiW
VDEDSDFFVRRAREERRAARISTDPAVAAAHAHLADQYEALVASYAMLENPLGSTTKAPRTRSIAARPPLGPKTRLR